MQMLLIALFKLVPHDVFCPVVTERVHEIRDADKRCMKPSKIDWHQRVR